MENGGTIARLQMTISEQYTLDSTVRYGDWPVVARRSLDREVLEALFANEVAAVRVPGFVATNVCARSAADIEAHGFGYYENVDPPIGRIGITQYEHMTAREEYLRKAAAANEDRVRLFSRTADPVALVRDSLSAAWGAPAGLATEPDGRSYFAGLIRIIGEALIHCDWGPRDAPGWTVGSVSAQLTWNIYYSLTENGGATTIFNRPWTVDLEALANAADYGYDPKAVDGIDYQVVVPEMGELVLFNPRNPHAVTRAVGSRSRITASSFIGLTPSNNLVMWS